MVDTRRVDHVYKAVGTPIIPGASTGCYGDVTKASLQRLFNRLVALDLIRSNETTFLDIGSGMGLPTIHFGTLFDCLSIGIELEYPLWLVSQYHIKKVYKRSALEGRTQPPVSFVLASITSAQTFNGFSLIYSFDILFCDVLLKQIAEIFNRHSMSRVAYISYHNPNKLSSVGFEGLQLLGTQHMDMTGSGESKTAYIYVSRKNCAAVTFNDVEVDPLFQTAFAKHKAGTLVQSNQEMDIRDLCPPRSTRSSQK